MILKSILFGKCQKIIDRRLRVISQVIEDISNNLHSETKSSAGDKHETGRAMLQIEQEKAGEQLAKIQKINQLLSRIDSSDTSKFIKLGSIVFTTRGNYYILISAGELQIDDQFFYAISANTPIAKLLLGKTEGDIIKFKEKEFLISKVI